MSGEYERGEMARHWGEKRSAPPGIGEAETDDWLAGWDDADAEMRQ